MYFFYFDESGSRDPSIGTAAKPKDHLYVLLAVGMFERQWFPFDRNIANLKLELADYLRRDGKGRFELADCEVKSNWVRNPKERAKKSPFLNALTEADLTRLTECFFDQAQAHKTIIMASVIDKRHLLSYMDHEKLHKKAYEFLLERIEHYMAESHPKHLALTVMDDTSKELNRAVAMKHAFFQRSGNQNIEYPYFARFWPNIYRRQGGEILDGLKVWPEGSPLIEKARAAWEEYKKKNCY